MIGSNMQERDNSGQLHSNKFYCHSNKFFCLGTSIATSFLVLHAYLSLGSEQQSILTMGIHFKQLIHPYECTNTAKNA